MYEKAEVIEVSLVSVPCNSEALRLRGLGVEPVELARARLLAELRRFLR